MSRLWCALIVVAVCAGCRNTPPVYDPFLGRQVVEPPGTATMAPAAPPYYTSPPGSTVGAPIVAPPAGMPTTAAPPPAAPPVTPPAPIPYSVPPGFAPAPAGFGSVTPNVSAPGSPLAQSAVAAASPAGNRPTYGLPGGMSFPQAAPTAAAQQAALAQQNAPGLLQPGSTNGARQIVSPTVASTPTLATPAGWQPADNNRSANAAETSTSDSSAGSISPNSGGAIRIVEPVGSVAPAAASAAASSTRAPTEFRPGNTSTLTMPPSGVSNSTLNQSLQQQPIRDLSDLPPVRTASYNSAPAASSVPMAAASGSSSNYGYDSQYRWVKGKLEYSQSTRTWRLRYIPPDAANDNYGGSVILADASKLASFQHGDYVVAYGILGQASADKGSFAAMYNVTQIQRQ